MVPGEVGLCDAAGPQHKRGSQCRPQAERVSGSPHAALHSSDLPATSMTMAFQVLEDADGGFMSKVYFS